MGDIRRLGVRISLGSFRKSDFLLQVRRQVSESMESRLAELEKSVHESLTGQKREVKDISSI